MYKILQTNTFESILLEKGKGSWVWDQDGKKYLDCVSGLWCVNVGHNHPYIAQALKKQIDSLIHRNMRFLTPVAIEAAEKVLDFVPGSYDRITFLNSGSEAMEFAINFACKVTRRHQILSLKDSYLGAYGLAKQASYHSHQPSELKIPYPECNRDSCNCLEEYGALIDKIIADYATDLACFVLEPIMVSGGIHKPCTAFIDELCKRLQEKNVLIVIDEVTCGYGRVGHRFGFQLYNFNPDIIATGKGMGNGYPISAIITKSQLEIKLSSNELYYAQSHQLDPLGSIVAKSVVEIFLNEKVIEKSKTKVQKISYILTQLQNPCIKEVRNIGMTFGLEIVMDNDNSTNNIILKIKEKLLEKGVVIGYSINKRLLRLLPSLTITNEEISFLQECLEEVFSEI
jgi:acetylornithine aminotransferase